MIGKKRCFPCFCLKPVSCSPIKSFVAKQNFSKQAPTLVCSIDLKYQQIMVLFCLEPPVVVFPHTVNQQPPGGESQAGPSDFPPLGQDASVALKGNRAAGWFWFAQAKLSFDSSRVTKHVIKGYTSICAALVWELVMQTNLIPLAFYGFHLGTRGGTCLPCEGCECRGLGTKQLVGDGHQAVLSCETGCYCVAMGNKDTRSPLRRPTLLPVAGWCKAQVARRVNPAPPSASRPFSQKAGVERGRKAQFAANCIPLQGTVCDTNTTRLFGSRPAGHEAGPNGVGDVRTIVITSGKGGVGKTTGTANLGMSIARLGYRVALIDADIGLRNLDLLLGLENRILYTAMDILDGQCRLDQALVRDKRWKNLSLLSISKNRQRYNVTRKNMGNLVKSIARLGYQFVLIDCPAGIDVGFINAISPAQEALIVTTPEITAIRDADRVAGLLEANGIYNVKLLVNRVRPDMIQRNDMMSVRDVQEMLGIPLLGAIPEDNHVIISTNRGEPLVLKRKLTLSGIAFENAARRLIGKQDYFIDLSTPYKGVFQKVQELFFG